MEEGERNWGAVRAELLSELVYWRNQRIVSDTRFLAFKEPKPSILFDENFHASQVAYAQVLTLKAQLENFDKEHDFGEFTTRI